MNKNDNNGNTEAKPELSAYPYTPLKSALEISDAVKELGGARSEVSKSALASHLGEPDKGQGFLQRITSAKAFGLIEGRSDYSLTEQGKRIYFPTSDSDKSNALLECLASPSTFRELIKRFDGDALPKRENLANILHRELGVPESWKARAAAFFENSAQLVGVIDGQGFLRYAAVLRSGAGKASGQEPKSQAKLQTPRFYGGGGEQQPEGHTFVLPLDKENKRKITVTAPLDVTPKEVQRISKWLEVQLVVGEFINEP